MIPDLTIYLRIDPATAAARAGEGDRIEGEGTSFQERVARAYERFAEAEPGRWRRIDAARRAEEIHADVVAAVEAARAAAAAA